VETKRLQHLYSLHPGLLALYLDPVSLHLVLRVRWMKILVFHVHHVRHNLNQSSLLVLFGVGRCEVAIGFGNFGVRAITLNNIASHCPHINIIFKSRTILVMAKDFVLSHYS
jgi:hypothetical protein